MSTVQEIEAHVRTAKRIARKLRAQLETDHLAVRWRALTADYQDDYASRMECLILSALMETDAQ